MNAEYIEAVSVGDERVKCVRLVVLVTIDTAAELSNADLSSGTQPAAALARTVARPVVEAIQAAIAAGKLDLP